jgi:hypothetical protein
MSDAPNRKYAVIMGDLVASEAASSIEQLHKEFNRSVRTQNKQQRKQLLSPLTITLGDEFQGITTSLATAWSIVRAIRFDLLTRNVDCRFAIGMIQLRTPLNPRNAWNMMGPGLSMTRDRLNERKAYTRYNFVLPGEPHAEAVLEALGAGLTAIERRWTNQQLHDIKASLEGLSPVEIAQRRNVTAHTIYKVRSSGEFDTYLLQWSAVAEALKRLDERYAMAI